MDGSRDPDCAPPASRADTVRVCGHCLPLRCAEMDSEVSASAGPGTRPRFLSRPGPGQPSKRAHDGMPTFGVIGIIKFGRWSMESRLGTVVSPTSPLPLCNSKTRGPRAASLSNEPRRPELPASSSRPGTLAAAGGGPRAAGASGLVEAARRRRRQWIQ